MIESPKLASAMHPQRNKHTPVIKGLAAVSSDPRPFPIMKIHAQKPPNDFCFKAAMARSAPRAYRQRPQMKTAR